MSTSVTPYDIFFSYHSRDQAAVQAVAEKLRERELRIFLDRWYLLPGRPWPQVLEEILGSCRAVAVFLGPNGMGRWQQSEAYLSLERQSRSPDFPVVPVLLPGADPALGFLSLNTWVDLRSSLDDPLAITALGDAIRGKPPGSDLEQRVAATLASVCPYRGLRAFREEDSPFFFGREALTDTLVETVKRRNFVAVVGSSGSGKSSVVRAGLVPRLRQAAGQTLAGESIVSNSRNVWDVVTLFPTDRPFHSVAAALLPLLEPEMDEVGRLTKIQELAGHLGESRLSLRDVAARVLEKQMGTDRLLLVVDQWEELYTLCGDETIRRRFVDELLQATDTLPLSVVITLRGDFFGHVLDYRPLVDRIDENIVKVPPLNPEELTLAIEQPAKRVALSFEPGLVDRIADEVDMEPGNLPLLEFALTQLWERRNGTELRHETYDAMHGVSGAVARRAEDIYSGLDSRQQEQVRQILIQLVRPGEGSEDTRRRATFDELGEGTRNVVQVLADNRLVVTARDETSGEETVEVAHEALIRRWDRFRGWMNADRAFRAWQERLRSALNQWEAKNRNNDALLRGVLLAEAEQQLNKRDANLSEVERQFIQAAVDLRASQREAQSLRRKKIVRWSVAATLLSVAVVYVSSTLLLWMMRDVSSTIVVRHEVAARRDDSKLSAWELLSEIYSIRGDVDVITKKKIATSDADQRNFSELQTATGLEFDALQQALKEDIRQSYFQPNYLCFEVLSVTPDGEVETIAAMHWTTWVEDADRSKFRQTREVGASVQIVIGDNDEARAAFLAEVISDRRMNRYEPIVSPIQRVSVRCETAKPKGHAINLVWAGKRLLPPTGWPDARDIVVIAAMDLDAPLPNGKPSPLFRITNDTRHVSVIANEPRDVNNFSSDLLIYPQGTEETYLDETFIEYNFTECLRERDQLAEAYSRLKPKFDFRDVFISPYYVVALKQPLWFQQSELIAKDQRERVNEMLDRYVKTLDLSVRSRIKGPAAVVDNIRVLATDKSSADRFSQEISEQLAAVDELPAVDVQWQPAVECRNCFVYFVLFPVRSAGSPNDRRYFGLVRAAFREAMEADVRSEFAELTRWTVVLLLVTAFLGATFAMFFIRALRAGLEESADDPTASGEGATASATA